MHYQTPVIRIMTTIFIAAVESANRLRVCAASSTVSRRGYPRWSGRWTQLSIFERGLGSGGGPLEMPPFRYKALSAKY